MHTMIIAAHPNLQQSRINKALLAAATEAGVHARNLYETYPDEQIDVGRAAFDGNSRPYSPSISLLLVQFTRFAQKVD